MQEAQANGGGQQIPRKPPVPLVNLADRRRNKKSMLDEENTDASQLEQLKQDAQNLENKRGGNQLEEINEDVDAEDEDLQNSMYQKNANNLTTINEENEEAGLTRNETMQSSQ